MSEMKKDGASLSVADAVTGLGFFVFGLCFFLEARRLPSFDETGLGSGYWPSLVCGAIMVFGLILAVQSATKNRGARYFSLDAEKRRNIPDFFKVGGLIIVYVALWGRVPYLVSTPILFAASTLILGLDWKRSLVSAVVVSAAIYAIFRLGLRVML
jgi:hypothetical protein